MRHYSLVVEPLPPYPTHLKDLDIPPSYDTVTALEAIDQLTPEERAKYEEGIAKAISAEDLNPALKDSATLAAEACKTIEDMFVSLTATLVSIDAKYKSAGDEGFAPKLGRIQKMFRDTVWDSQKLALDISHYAERFEDVILPFCADKSLSIDQRLRKLDKFIKDADGFAIASDNMKSRFENLKDDFAKFVGTFGEWANGKEKEDSDRITELQEEIAGLQKELAKLDGALKALLITLGATLPLTGIIAIFAGPAAPLVMAAGAIIAGLELTSVIGIVIAKNITQNKIDGKNNEVKRLQDEIKTIQATRVELEETGEKDLQIFSDNINALAMVWQSARNDAYQVRQWLEDGAEDADIPAYMDLSIGKAVGVYRAMARYLKGYADGITNADIPSPTSFQ